MAPGQEQPESDPRRAQFPAAFRTRTLRGSQGGVSATVFKQLSRERHDLARLQPEAASESGDLTIRDLTPPSAPPRCWDAWGGACRPPNRKRCLYGRRGRDRKWCCGGARLKWVAFGAWRELVVGSEGRKQRTARASPGWLRTGKPRAKETIGRCQSFRGRPRRRLRSPSDSVGPGGSCLRAMTQSGWGPGKERRAQFRLQPLGGAPA